MTIVRMPPSPTGHLHLGTARTALFNYLFAKNKEGQIIFRWEDTDRERSSAEFETEILEGLKWLGMDFEKESHLFCRQTENEAVHKEWLAKLWEQGKVFPCFVTPEEIEAQRHEAQKNKTNFVFWSPFRDESREVLEAKMKTGEKYVWRIKAPRDTQIAFDDLIRGPIEVSSETLGDFVVARADGSVLYLLANVVDDWTQGVTHIFRGEDHISNTPKQVMIYDALGADKPAFGHIPLVLDSKKRKLSKRNVEPGVCVLIKDFQAAGFVPEAVVNGLALTGWNPKSTEEVFSLEKLIEVFDIKHVNKSAAQYNFDKMIWLNTHWVRNMDVSTLIGHVNELNGTSYGAEHKKAFEVARLKARDLNEVEAQLEYLLSDPGLDASLLQNEKMKIDEEMLSRVLPEIKTMLEGIEESDWNPEYIRERCVESIAKLEIKNGQFLNPFRVALSNQSVSAGPFDIAVVIGKEETLNRIKRAVNLFL